MRARVVRCDAADCTVEAITETGDPPAGWIRFEEKDFDCYRCVSAYAMMRSREVRAQATLGYDAYDPKADGWRHDTY